MCVGQGTVGLPPTFHRPEAWPQQPCACGVMELGRGLSGRLENLQEDPQVFQSQLNLLWAGQSLWWPWRVSGSPSPQFCTRVCGQEEEGRQQECRNPGQALSQQAGVGGLFNPPHR